MHVILESSNVAEGEFDLKYRKTYRSNWQSVNFTEDQLACIHTAISLFLEDAETRTDRTVIRITARSADV